MEKLMNVILSIKPQFAYKILSGKKRYEYRKAVFRRPVNRVFIYASSPVCKIVGEFTIHDLISGSPRFIWSETKEYAGIEATYFEKYFAGKDTAYALCISSYKKYDKPIDPKQKIPGFRAPQSFCYVNTLNKEQ